MLVLRVDRQRSCVGVSGRDMANVEFCPVLVS